jgi:hypothetical protein
MRHSDSGSDELPLSDFVPKRSRPRPILKSSTTRRGSVLKASFAADTVETTCHPLRRTATKRKVRVASKYKLFKKPLFKRRVQLVTPKIKDVLDEHEDADEADRRNAQDSEKYRRYLVNIRTRRENTIVHERITRGVESYVSAYPADLLRFEKGLRKLEKANEICYSDPPPDKKAWHKVMKVVLEDDNFKPLLRKAEVNISPLLRNSEAIYPVAHLVAPYHDKEAVRRFKLVESTSIGMKAGPIDWRRELKVLRYLSHDNIIRFEEAYLFENGFKETGGTEKLVGWGLYDIGTVRQLSDKYKHVNSMKDYVEMRIYPPEHFVWHVLKSILTALIHMRTGYSTLHDYCSRETDAVKNWMPIYHLDVRADNVLLKSTVGDFEYPHVTLGGFGHAVSDEGLAYFGQMFFENDSLSGEQLRTMDMQGLLETILTLVLASPVVRPVASPERWKPRLPGISLFPEGTPNFYSDELGDLLNGHLTDGGTIKPMYTLEHLVSLVVGVDSRPGRLIHEVIMNMEGEEESGEEGEESEAGSGEGSLEESEEWSEEESEEGREAEAERVKGWVERWVEGGDYVMSGAL